VVACLLFFPALGSFGIMDPSDGLYAESAREMVELRDYMTPHFNYAPFLEKPILVYWFIIASYKLFGVSELSARLPAALAALETVCFIFLSLRQILSPKAVLLCALITASNMLFAVVGHLALTDMELTCFTTLSALSLFQALNSANKPAWQPLVAAYLCLTATLLLKGPVIIIIALLSLIANKLILNRVDRQSSQKTLWQYLQPLKPVQGAVLVGALALPWYFIENTLTKGAFFNEFVIHQNLGRITGTVNHIEPWWFYLPYLACAFMPWTLLLPVISGLIRRLFRNRRPLSARSKLFLFTLVWACVSFTFFSLIKTKLPTYVLPGVPAACICIGIALDTISKRRLQQGNSLLAGFALFFMLLAIGGIAALKITYEKIGEPSAGALLGFIAAIIVCLLAAPTLGWFLTREGRLPALVIVGFWTTCIMFAVPSSLLLFYKLKHSDLRALVLHYPDANLATFWRDTTAGVFYHRKKVPLVSTIEDLKNFRENTPGRHLVVVTRDLIPFLYLESQRHPVRCIETRGNYSVFELVP
jgi:4-amino-4-deoxy-L-arabinose transferase-like glycosyltransferase